MTSYLLAGDPLLTQEALARLRAEQGLDELSQVVLSPADPVPAFGDALGTASLFGGRRLVVVRDAEDLLKDQVDVLTRFVEDPGPDAVLVLLTEGRTKLDAAVRKHGNALSLAAPKGRKLVTWLRERARKRGLKLDERAAWALIDAVGPGLRDLDSALTQLGGGGAKAVTVEVVERAFTRHADERTFAFTDAVGERRLDTAMTTLRRLLDQGEPPLVVFGSLAAHLRRLLRARPYASSGARTVGDVLGMPEWRAEKLLKQVRAYREEELIAALGLLARVDVELKGDFPAPAVALERAVARIVTGALG